MVKIVVYVLGIVVGLPLGWLITKLAAVIWNLCTNPVDRFSYEIEQSGFSKIILIVIGYGIGIFGAIGILATVFGVNLN